MKNIANKKILRKKKKRCPSKRSWHWTTWSSVGECSGTIRRCVPLLDKVCQQGWTRSFRRLLLVCTSSLCFLFVGWDVRAQLQLQPLAACCLRSALMSSLWNYKPKINSSFYKLPWPCLITALGK